MNINEMCEKQYDWVERMGWHNGTPLEKLALIASEVGEAIDELPKDHRAKGNLADVIKNLARAVNCCRGESLGEEFGYELADIVLRVADLAQEQGVDLQKCIIDKMAINEKRGTRGRKI